MSFKIRSVLSVLSVLIVLAVPMAAESPTSIDVVKNLEGELSDITDLPSVSDLTWLTAPKRLDGDLLVTIPLPKECLAGPQRVRVSVRGATAEPVTSAVLATVMQGSDLVGAGQLTIQSTGVQLFYINFSADRVPCPCKPLQVRIRSALGNFNGGFGPAMEIGAVRLEASTVRGKVD